MTPTRRLLHYFNRFKAPFIAGGVCVIASAMFSLLKPLIIGNAVNELAGAVSRQMLIRYGVLLIVVAAFEGLFLYLQRWSW